MVGGEDATTLFRSATSARLAVRLTTALAAASAISSLGGVLFERALYWRDLAYWTTQVLAQDLINLVVVLPLLLIAVRAIQRGDPRGLPLWLGLTLFLTYLYTCYGFALRFNRLFLVDCLAFGLCIYVLVLAFRDVRTDAAGTALRGEPRLALWTLALTGSVMTLFWLAVAIPAVIDDRLPEYAAMNGYVSSPIHMLDLGVFFPGLVVAAAMLKRGSDSAPVFGPALLVFSLVMTSCLIVEAMALAIRGFGGGLEFTPIFAVVAAASLAAIARWMRPVSSASRDDASAQMPAH